MLSELESLESLGLDAARQIAGHDAIERVEVTSGEDRAERPIYHFSFLVDESRIAARLGVLRTRLVQTLRDALVARQDAHFPVIQILSRADWDRRESA